MPMRVRWDLSCLAVTLSFSFVMMIQWLADRFSPNFVGYFLVFFTAFVILQGSVPDWLFERILFAELQRRKAERGRASGEEDYEDEEFADIIVAFSRMVNVVSSNWNIWLICGALEVFTWSFVQINHPGELVVSVIMMVTTVFFFFTRRFLLSDEFPRPVLLFCYYSYYVLCIIPVSYNNALLGSPYMTALRQLYYLLNCFLYFYLVPARNRTSQASSLVATTHIIYPLYGHWVVLTAGVIPTTIMSYMALKKAKPFFKIQYRFFRDKLHQIRGSRDVFDIGMQEATALDDDDDDDDDDNDMEGV